MQNDYYSLGCFKPHYHKKFKISAAEIAREIISAWLLLSKIDLLNNKIMLLFLLLKSSNFPLNK